MPETRQSLLSKLTTARQELIQAQVRVSELETLFADHAETLGDAQASASDESIFVKLSDFPKENPNPVLAVARDGTLLYANPASRYLLALLDCQLGTQLPEILQATVAETFITATPREFEAIYDDIHFALTFVPVVNAGYGYLYGLDITERKRSELALKRYAQLIEILHEIDTSIINANTIPEVIEATLKSVRQIILCQRATVILFDWVTNEWLIFADDANRRYSLGQEIRTSIPPGWDDGFGSETTRIFDDLRLSRPQMPHYETLIKDGLVSGIQALFVVQGNRIGLLGLNADTPGFFTAEHKEIVTQIASQLAIAVHQMHLTEEKVHHSQIVEGLGNFLQATMDAFPANMTVLDPDGKIISVNLPWKHFADDNDGHSETHYLGTNYLTVSDMAVGPISEEGASAAAGIRAVIAGQQEDFYLEYPCHSPTEERWFMLRVTPFAESAPRRVVVAHINITERKVAEKALRASEEKYRSLVDSSDAVIAMFDVEGKILYANQIAVNALHLTPETIVGKHMNDLFPSPISQYQLEAIRQVIRTGIGTVSEAPSSVFREERWYRTSVQPVRDASSNVIAALISAADITPFKQAEESLHEAHDKLEQRVIERTAQLQIAKERVEAVLNNSPDAILLADSDFTIRQTNSSFDTLFACASDNYFGKSLVTLIREEDIEQVKKLLAAVVTEQRGQSAEIYTTRKDGTGFDAELGIGYIRDNGLVCTIRDITERKAQERQLRYFASLQESVVDAVIVTDTEFHIQTWNLGAERIYGWTNEDVIGKLAPELLQIRHPATQDQGAARQQFSEQGFLQQETIQRRKDGTDIYILGSATLLTDKNGVPVGVISVNRDITERKAQERQLRYHASLQENVSDAVIVTDMEFRIKSWNKAAERMYGWSAEEVVSKATAEVLDTVYPSTIDQEGAIKQLYKQGWWQGEVIQHHKDGSVRHILGSVTIIKDENGTTFDVVSVNHDITERKQADEILRQSEERFALVFRLSPVAIALTTAAEGRYLNVNDSLLLLLGYSRDEMIDRTTSELNVWETPEHRATVVRTLHEKGSVRGLEVGFRKKTGEMCITLTSIEPVILNGQSCFLSIIHDITERKRAEEALRESEQKFRLLLDAAPIATIISDQMGDISLINIQAETMFGFNRTELVGQSIDVLVPDNVRNGHAAKRATYMAEPRLRQMGAGLELAARRKDGSEFPVEIELSYIETQAGLLIMSFVEDITERKRIAAELERQRIFLRQVIDVSPSMIFVKDYDARFVLANPLVATMYNTTVEDLIGKTDADFNPSLREVESFLENDRRVITSGELLFTEEPITNFESETHWLQTTKVPIISEDGKSQYVLGISTDITERKRAELALKESEEKYRSLIETMRGGLVIFDLDNKITYINDRFCEILGYTRDEVMGTRAVDYIDPTNQSTLELSLQRRQNLESSTYELLFRHKNGSRIYLLVSGSPLLPSNGEHIGSFAVITDITVQKQAEDMLRQSLDKEKELSELKSRFVSMASHEFRTPLATILVVTETLSAYRHKLTEEQIEQRFDKIKDQVGHLKGIMEDVLMLARMQARRVEFNPVKMDLDALARSVLDDFESRPDVKHKLEYIIGERNQEALLDRKLMQQIISNLVSNAVKYSPEGKLVRIHLEYTDAEVILKISDEGIGIPEADLPHLFEPFHRAANVGTISGTGLGLVITREAVELHGGTITVESQQGTGTTFTIRIPISAEGQKSKQRTS